MRKRLLYMGLATAMLSCHDAGQRRLGEGTSFHVGAGHPRSFQLPDGSTAMLSPETTITLAKGYGKDNRIVDVDGEVVFEVTGMAGMYGRPFIVRTHDLEIEVLDTVGVSGAHFHLDAFRAKAGEEVDLLAGRLRVKKSYHSDTDNEPEVLAAGEMVMINREIDLMEKEKLNPAELKKLGVD